LLHQVGTSPYLDIGKVGANKFRRDWRI